MSRSVFLSLNIITLNYCFNIQITEMKLKLLFSGRICNCVKICRYIYRYLLLHSCFAVCVMLLRLCKL